MTLLARWFALFAIAITAACQQSAPVESITLERGLSAQPESLDPHLARSVAATKVLGDLYEGLYTRDAAGQLLLGVAESVQISEDKRHYTFILSDDARYSNGDRVSAEDFRASWQRLADPATGAFYADLINGVKNAKAIMAGTAAADTLAVFAPAVNRLEVELENPQADFLARLAHVAFSPLHKSARNNNRVDAQLISNGAYRLIDLQAGSELTLARNEYFHDLQNVAITRVRYWTMEQEQTEYNRFRAGEIDITSRVPRQVFLGAKSERPAGLHSAPYLGVVYLAINLRAQNEPPSAEVRAALSMAIDRDFLASKIIGRGEQPAWQLVPPGIAGYQSPQYEYARLTQAQRDDNARALFAAAGYGETRPLALTLHYANSDENRVLAVALQAMWQTALPGLEVQINNMEFRVLLAASRRGELNGLLRASWIADYDDPAQFMQLLHSQGAGNASGFSDTSYDALLSQAQVAANPAERMRLLAQAEQIVLQQHPILPLYFFVSKHLISERVVGWQDNPLDLHYSRFLKLSTSTQPGY